MTRPLILAPSILGCNPANLSQGLLEAQGAGAEWIHVDIMDGHFVPHLSFGAETLRALKRQFPQFYYDTHLMVEYPSRFLKSFSEAGADGITIHQEAKDNPLEVLAAIKRLGINAGIAISPQTPGEVLSAFLPHVDLVLIMTVFPGKSGQAFLETMLPKIQYINTERRERKLNFRLEVDGGIDIRTALLCNKAGADTFVSGNSFFTYPEKATFCKSITQLTPYDHAGENSP